MRVSQKSPNPTDKHVGVRIRMRRMMLDMSQTVLASALNLTFQQVQKYEKGANRVGASRLQQISHVLQVPVTFFFEGGPNAEPPNGRQLKVDSPEYVHEFLSTSDGLNLVAAFQKIDNSKLRRRIVDLVEQIVEHHAESCA